VHGNVDVGQREVRLSPIEGELAYGCSGTLAECLGRVQVDDLPKLGIEHDRPVGRWQGPRPPRQPRRAGSGHAVHLAFQPRPQQPRRPPGQRVGERHRWLSAAKGLPRHRWGHGTDQDQATDPIARPGGKTEPEPATPRSGHDVDRRNRELVQQLRHVLSVVAEGEVGSRVGSTMARSIDGDEAQPRGSRGKVRAGDLQP